MNDTDDAALGDRYTDDEEPGAYARYLEDEGEDPGPEEPPPAPWETSETPTERRSRDREDVALGLGGYSGASQREQERRDDGRDRPTGGPPRRMWPGHEDCGGIHHYDDEDGYVCRCGEVLGLHWPDTDEIERTVAEVQARPRADIDVRDPIRSVMQPLARDNITPAEVEGHLADILTRLETGLQYERWCADEYTRIKLERDVAMAKTTRDRKGGAADVRRAEALIENEDLVRECDLAEGRWKAVRDTMHTVRSLQHGYQSILKSVRDTMVSPAQGRGGWHG